LAGALPADTVNENDTERRHQDQERDPAYCPKS